jgi:hypothetical protein
MRQYTRGNAYAYDLKTARDYILWYREMVELMAAKFPNIVRIIAYEDMVADPAAVRATAAELCGLPASNAPLPAIGSDIGCSIPYQRAIAAAFNDQF